MRPFSALSSTAIALAALVAMTAGAGAAERVRVRGTVIGLNGQTLAVQTREGSAVDIALADGWGVSGMARVAVADIKPGDFVGIASLPRDKGGDGALEVLVFPPAMKGTGEGSYGWDLKPNSSMTNATVAEVKKAEDEHTLTLSWQGKEKTIAIPEGTPIVTFAAASPSDLTPGAVVFINGEKTDAGTISTKRVVVGTNGVVPPM
jgi:hypothetical protein